MKKYSFLSISALIAAIYAVVTLLTASFSFGPVQLRLAEALCFMVYVNPAYIWSIGIGTLLANIFSPVGIVDTVIGTAASVLGCLAASKIKNKWLFPVPVILVNALMVGWEIAYFYIGDCRAVVLAVSCIQVAAGEAAVLYFAGLPMLKMIEKKKLKHNLMDV